MRLYGISPVDIELALARPLLSDLDERGNTRVTGLDRGRLAIIVVVANDDPDFVITAFLEN